EVRDEPVVRGLADRAGVEQDQVGLLAMLGLDVAQRIEHPPHPLGGGLVHLAPEGGDVIAALHRAQCSSCSDYGVGPPVTVRSPSMPASLWPGPRPEKRYF